MMPAREAQQTQATAAQEQYRANEESRYEQPTLSTDEDDDEDLVTSDIEEEESEAVSA